MSFSKRDGPALVVHSTNGNQLFLKRKVWIPLSERVAEPGFVYWRSAMDRPVSPYFVGELHWWEVKHLLYGPSSKAGSLSL